MAVTGVDDWLVSDSENEDSSAQLPPEMGPETSESAAIGSAVAVSVIQTAVFTPDQLHTSPRDRQSPSASAGESLFTPPPVRTDSSISNFTSVPSTSAAPVVIVPRPRPRPRVVMKKTITSNFTADMASTSFSHISDPPASVIKQTNDGIYPATATSFGFFDAVDDAYSSFDIAERAKMRSRKSQATRKSIQPPVQMTDVIELTTDEDELTLKPTKRQRKQGDPSPKPAVQIKPRPKPRLKVKPAIVSRNDSPPSPNVIRDPPAPTLQSSQPPASTLPTIPPSTPPQVREPTPHSSPLVTIRKRKRIRPLITEDDDEMDIIGGNSSSSMMPPPFFAPSSSSVPTDSGIEIPPVELLSGRGRKKQVLSGKIGAQKRAGYKGRKGKKGEITGDVDEAVDDPAGMTHEPATPITRQSPSFAKEHHPIVTRNSPTTEEHSEKKTIAKKGKARVIGSEEEDELALPPKSNADHIPSVDEGECQISKENLRPDDLSSKRDSPPNHTSIPGLHVRSSSIKPKSTPMSELIRRVNSQPSSPFPNASRPYSPFLKSSRTMLSRIAPLHPNRRTPPPPLPRPPPPKKSKKQVEMEERIEEELEETVDGWSCLTDDERKVLRKARIDAELGCEE